MVKSKYTEVNISIYLHFPLRLKILRLARYLGVPFVYEILCLVLVAPGSAEPSVHRAVLAPP